MKKKPFQEDVEDRLGRLGFKKDKLGYIVYKTFGLYQCPQINWVLAAGSFITTSKVLKNPDEPCGMGINFATIGWINREVEILHGHTYSGFGNALWRCRIRFEDLDKVVVPYGRFGKARCGRLELLRVIKRYK